MSGSPASSPHRGAPGKDCLSQSGVFLRITGPTNRLERRAENSLCDGNTSINKFTLDNSSAANYYCLQTMNSNQRQEKRRADTRGVVAQIARIREQANLLIEEELRGSSMTGLLPAHGSVLNYLFQQRGPVAIREVVKRVGRVKSTVTGMLNTLEQHGYVHKTASDTDRRVILVELTKKGRALKPNFDRISERLIRRLYGSMSQQDRETLARLLSELERNLRKAQPT